jgi:molybdate transport system regulatory protein
MKHVDPSSSRGETGPAGVRLAHRIWLQDGGTPVFGAGISELLGRVEATGSLRQAASDMGMAYSKAWQIVRRAEEHLGFKLMARRAGGKGGGCSTVSDEGRWLVRAFGAMTEEADPLLAELFDRHFRSWNGVAGAPRAEVPSERVRGKGA